MSGKSSVRKSDLYRYRKCFTELELLCPYENKSILYLLKGVLFSVSYFTLSLIGIVMKDVIIVFLYMFFKLVLQKNLSFIFKYFPE